MQLIVNHNSKTISIKTGVAPGIQYAFRSFYACRFPKPGSAAYQQWVSVCQRSTTWTPAANSRLCSKHFSESCFKSTPQRKRTLISGSAPDNDPPRPKRRLFDHSYAQNTKDAEIRKVKEEVSSLKHKVRYQKTKLEKLNKVLANKDQLIKHGLNEQQINSLAESYTGIAAELMGNEIRNADAPPTGRRYSEKVKEFCLTLHYYSPVAYDYMRQGQLFLPHPESLHHPSGVRRSVVLLDSWWTSLRASV